MNVRGVAMILALSAAAASDAFGRTPGHLVATPVVVALLGPDAVRVRVATGPNMPCDSIDNRTIIDGRFAAGQIVRATAVGNGCVCFQQTYAPLSDSDWSTPAHLCTACSYNPYTRIWTCPPQREPTISIRVASAR
jgi:hypothetical protein